MPKFWTKEDSLKLYRLVELGGSRWTEYSEVFGITPEAVRNKYRHTDWEALFADCNLTEEQVLSEDEEILDQLAELEEETEEELLLNEKERILKNAEMRKHVELVRKLATEDIIIEKITSAIIAAPKIESEYIKVPNVKYDTGPQDVALVLSDLHVGLAVVAEEVGGISEYNVEKFKTRLWSLVEKVIRITGHHRKSCEIETLNIFNLGDNVHGSNDAGQWGFVHTEQNIVDQVFTLLTEVEKAILTFAKYFKNINFYGVIGNHGRCTKRGVEKLFVNWDYLFYKFLEKGLTNQSNINFYSPRAPFQIANIRGNKFLLVHGDTVRSWAGIPFYGLMRAESKYRSLLDRTKNVEDLWVEIDKLGIKDPKEMLKFAYEYCKSFDIMISGHFHQLAEMETVSGGRIILNSSFAGGDDYSINSLLTASTPCQKFFGIHKEGKSFLYDISLERE